MLICDGLASAAEWDRLEQHMTLPRLAAILAECAEAPPLRRLAAAWLVRRPAGRAGGFEAFIRAWAPDGKATVLR
jgi:hypothetical protein